jgi:hypothetical protein
LEDRQRRKGSLPFYDEILNGLPAFRLKSEELIAVKDSKTFAPGGGKNLVCCPVKIFPMPRLHPPQVVNPAGSNGMADRSGEIS